MSSFRIAKTSADFKLSPYWWEEGAPEVSRLPLPSQSDVVIVGSGYCGLHAAIEFARHGRSVVVVDKDEIGAGGSTRSGGMVSSGQKLVLTGAIKGLSSQQLSTLLAESLQSFNFLKAFIGEHQLDADLQLFGRFFGAYAPSHYERLVLQGRLLHDKTGVNVHNIDKANLCSVLGSDFYHGGILVDDYGGLHVGKYHRALREMAKSVGVVLCSHAGMKRVVAGTNGLKRVQTDRGDIQARDVIVATNGYTGSDAPFLNRRIVPVASYIVTTEPLPADIMARLIPKRRMITDSQNNLYYLRPTPDNTRLLLGARPVVFDTTVEHAADKLYQALVRIFPELQGIALSHAWKGFVGMTLDKRAHIETHDGVMYVSGCNGNGVALMSYLGNRVARDVLGLESNRSAFGATPYPTAWYYGGKPWFVPPATAMYEVADAYAALTR